MPLKWDVLQSVNTCLMLGFTLTSSLISSLVIIIPGPFFAATPTLLLSHSTPLISWRLSLFLPNLFSISCCAFHSLSLFLRSSLFIRSSPLLCSSLFLCSSLPLSSCSSITISRSSQSMLMTCCWDIKLARILFYSESIRNLLWIAEKKISLSHHVVPHLRAW